MAKITGLAQNLYVAGVDLSGDTGSLSGVHGGFAPIDVTSINRSAYERIGGRRDGGLSWVSFFNDAASAAHLTLRGLPTTDVHVMYVAATSVGGAAVCGVVKQMDYAGTRASDGTLTFDVPTMGNGFGIEMMGAGADGMLTAGLRTDTAATNGTSIDYGAVSTLFGLSAYLQVTAFTGTTITFTIQDSADNVSFAAVTDATFAAVTAAPAVERIQTTATQTVRRYVRLATTGTFTSCTFAVAFIRHQTATL